MRLRICTCNPARLHINVSVPDDLRSYLLPGAEPLDMRFEEGRIFSQRITGTGFRITDFHITLHRPVTLIPESDNVTVLIAYLLRGRATGLLHPIPCLLHFAESHAYLLQLTAGPGNEIYLDPGEYRAMVLLFENDIRHTLLREYPRLQPAYYARQPAAGGLPYPPVRLGFKELYHISRIMPYKGKPNRIDAFLEAKVKTLIYRLMLRLDEQDDVQQKMREVQDHILRHLHRRPTTDELRKIAGMNRNALARHFKAYTGRKLKDYMRHERMMRACLLIDRDGKNLKEVAAALGYQNSSNFSADFRKWSGCSLTEFLADPKYMLQKSAFS